MSDVTVRDLRHQIRDWRRGRVTKPIMEAIGDAYIVLFTIVTLGAMLISAIIEMRSAGAAGCNTAACHEARTATAWLSALLAVACCLAVARLLGPILVSPAVGSWLLAAPVDRSQLLRSRLIVSALLSAASAALVTAGGGILSGFSASATGWVSGLAAAVAVFSVALAARSQAGSAWPVRLVTWLLLGTFWLGLLLVPLGVLPDAFTREPPTSVLRLATAVATVAAVVTLVLAARALPSLKRARLMEGGALLPGLSGALSGLDLTLAYDLLSVRYWRRRATVRVVRGRGAGVSALIWWELVRLTRTPGQIVVLYGSLVVPYLIASLGFGTVTLLLISITGFVVGVSLFTSLRVLARTRSLVRSLPLPAAAIKGACLSVPAALMMIWALLTIPAVLEAIDVPLGDATLLALAVGLGSVAGGVRWMVGQPPDYRMPLVASPMGAVPTALYASVFRGFDVILLAMLPILFFPEASGAMASLGLSALVLSVLVSKK